MDIEEVKRRVTEIQGWRRAGASVIGVSAALYRDVLREIAAGRIDAQYLATEALKGEVR